MIPAELAPLANHLWQSSLFTGSVWLLTPVLRKNRAAVRHGLWFAASMKFLIPFSLLTAIGAQIPWKNPTPMMTPPAPILTLGEPFAVDLPVVAPSSPPLLRAAPISVPLLAGVWLCGFGASLALWFYRWRKLARIRRKANLLKLDLPIRVLSCDERLEPGVFGVFRPVLLLPAGIAKRLSAEEFQAVLAHELCHVRRRDNLTAALHLFVEALFWFHPLVWWIRFRLIEEQERACDEAVLASGGDAQVYAESILKVCEFYLASPLLCARGITGARLKDRIREVMAPRIARKLNLSRKVLLAACGTLAIAGPIAVGFGHLSAARGQSELRFEVASIRTSDPANPPAPLSGGDRFPACGGYRMRIDPGRFEAQNMTVFKLITWAYGIRYSCYIVNDAGLVSGGPKWVLTDRFDIQATIPPNVPQYTPQQLQDAAAPELQAMLRSLLAERFQLALRRSSKEMAVYELTLAPGGPKLAPPDKDKPKRETLRLDPDENQEDLVHILGNQASLADLTHLLETVTATPVLDRTGTGGEYSFDAKFAVLDPSGGQIGNRPWAAGPSVFQILQEQLGLKLAQGRGPVDAWVIERAEKPSAN